MSALDDRREAAWAEFYAARVSAPSLPPEQEVGMAEAIETATRVRITPEMISEARYEIGHGATTEEAWRVSACLLRAAGFEVEE